MHYTKGACGVSLLLCRTPPPLWAPSEPGRLTGEKAGSPIFPRLSLPRLRSFPDFPRLPPCLKSGIAYKRESGTIHPEPQNESIHHPQPKLETRPSRSTGSLRSDSSCLEIEDTRRSQCTRCGLREIHRSGSPPRPLRPHPNPTHPPPHASESSTEGKPGANSCSGTIASDCAGGTGP